MSGERAGNAPLASVQAILKDQFNAQTGIDESRLNEVSRMVESYSGIPSAGFLTEGCAKK